MPYITTGILDLDGNNSFQIDTSGTALNDLLIDSIIQHGGIVKTGTGVLTLGSAANANTFAGGFPLNQGTVSVAGPARGRGHRHRPEGSNGSIVAAAAAIHVANPITVNGNLTMGGNLSFFLDGTMTLGSRATLTVNAVDQNQILYLGPIVGGPAAGTAAVIKTGVGPARFNIQGSTYSGDTLIESGNMSINVAAPPRRTPARPVSGRRLRPRQPGREHGGGLGGRRRQPTRRRRFPR